MALVEQEKKGGRCSRKEQEERRLHVYHLHFEENKSAVKIAELLGVNRNTINGDVAYWHSQLAHEINSQDLSAKMTKQFQRMEMQRDRLMEDLENTSPDERFRIEKFISEIDNRLMQFYSKMILSGKTTLEPTVKINEMDEDEIKEFVRELIFDDGLEELYSETQLKFRFIRKTKCNVNQSENILEKMKQDGLVFCEQNDEKYFDYFKSITLDSSRTYNLEKFAHLRGYVTLEELGGILTKRLELEAEIKKSKELREKLNQKYGDESEWPEEILEKFDSGELDDSILE